MNYCDFLFKTPVEYGNNTALVDLESGERYTYLQLQHSVKALSHFLKTKGYKSGDVIVTHLYNSAQAVLAHLSIQHCGCISCLLDPLITAQGLCYYLKDTQCKCLITHLGVLPDLIPSTISVMGPEDIKKNAANNEEELAGEYPYSFGENECAVIFYTSGTTDQPKGVKLSPKNFYSHVKIFTRFCYRYETSDNLLCFVPFSHGYGSKSIFLPCLQAGATMVIMRSFHPLKVIQAIEKENITHIFGVPSHFQQLLRRDELVYSLKKLKAAFSAAALLKLETAAMWKEKVGFFLDEGYGLIETCTGIAFRRARKPNRLGDIGTYPSDLVQIEVVDDDFNVLSFNHRGEIVVRGDSVMLGYLNKIEETERVLRDGWFRTGDMGYKTKENNIILTGRIKDVINVAGIKVAPFEVEAILNEHPKVNESAVIGVEDDMYGEVVKAFVKLEIGAESDERELVQFLQKRLMNFQVPKEIIFMQDFPRNNMGKIDKKLLRNF